MTDLTSEEYRELADLRKETAENLRRITEALTFSEAGDKKPFFDRYLDLSSARSWASSRCFVAYMSTTATHGRRTPRRSA